MTAPYSETPQGEWYTFDPNVHYYYDEQGQLHYYDPNTNLDCDYQPHYDQPNAYYATNTTQVYTPQTEPTVSSGQETPDVLLPCPEATCNGENKPKSKFCEECGRPLGAISRSATPLSQVTRAFSQHTIQETNYNATQYYPQQAIQRPPTAPPVYSSADPGHLGHFPDTRQQQPFYNGVQHQSMQNLYTNTQPQIDPLNRARGCPIVTFAFGGKMLVTFPRTVTNYYSSTVKPQPGPIKIRHLKDIIQPVHFPGPLLFDSKAGIKQKKKDIMTFITNKLQEFESWRAPLTIQSVAYHQLQAKILLWQLVKVLVETEGTINDKDKMDLAILNVIRPSIDNTQEESYFSLPSCTTPLNDEEDISDRMLSKIEQLLLQGDRKGAVDYAVQEDLWAHALIISSCVDKELWQKVITNFVDREMNATPDMRRNRTFHHIAGSNQALRVMYSLFSGAGGNAMSQFLLSDVQHVNTPYGLQTVTPTAELSQLVKWRDTLAIMLANRTPRDTNALTAFGDIMKEQGWLDAAHICYLLSPQDSMHSGMDTIQVRMTLLGSESTDIEAYQLTEIFEYAYSLHHGGVCLPFLQGYKLAHAWILSDYGLLDQVDRYHDAVDQSIKSFTKGSPYLHTQLTNALATLGTFLENASEKKNGVDPSSWLKPKFQKRALTSLWGSLEGSFTKFVSGDEIVAQEPAPSRKSTEIMSRPMM